jgi:hypothetical protein
VKSKRKKAEDPSFEDLARRAGLKPYRGRKGADNVTLPFAVYIDLINRAVLSDAEYIYLQFRILRAAKPNVKVQKLYEELAARINRGQAVQRLRREIQAAINKATKPAKVLELCEVIQAKLSEAAKRNEVAKELRKEIRQLRERIDRVRTVKELSRVLSTTLDDGGFRYTRKSSRPVQMKTIRQTVARMKKKQLQKKGFRIR